MTTSTLRALCVTAALLVSCRGAEDSAGDAGIRTVSALRVVAGGDQSGVAGEELPRAVVVQAVDPANAPLPGQAVAFRVVTGGGSVLGGSAITDVNGLARERWILGTIAGPQELEVRAVDSRAAAAVLSASVTATAIAGAPAAVSVAGGNGQSGQQLAALANPTMAHVADRYGNAVAGASVTFAPAAGNGYTTPASARTDPSGNASTIWTLGRPIGPQTLLAHVATLPAATFGATATGAPVQAHLVLVSGDGQTAFAGYALAAPVVVRLQDLSGARIAGQAITFSPAGGSGSAAPRTATTAADGTAGTSWSLGPGVSVQQLTVTATDPVTGQAVSPLTVTATSRGGPAARVWSRDGEFFLDWAGSTQSVTAYVDDASFHAVADETVTFVVSRGGGAVSPATARTDAHGLARTTWTLGPVVGQQVLEARVGTLPPEVYTATALGPGPYDGAYTGWMNGCLSIWSEETFEPIRFTVQNSLISWCSWAPASCLIYPDDGGAFFFRDWNNGNFGGWFVIDRAGVSTGSGRYWIDDGCSGTWTATRK